jgi:hypothetical protein
METVQKRIGGDSHALPMSKNFSVPAWPITPFSSYNFLSLDIKFYKYKDKNSCHTCENITRYYW